MQVSNVTTDDGKKCAQLINLLRTGKWELSGPDIMAHSETVRWVVQLAQSMGEQMKKNSPPSEVQQPVAQPMRVKAMGSIGSSMKKKRK